MPTPSTALDVHLLLKQRGAASAVEAFNVTVSDTTADPSGPFRALWIGAAGSVKVTTLGGQDVTFVGATAGSILPIACTKVFDTGTTVTGTKNTNILGLR